MTDTWVYVDTEHGWVNVDETEFLDIEESPYGDVMHFTYEGRDYSSKIVIGSRPA
jgi:hypothetical protein